MWFSAVFAPVCVAGVAGKQAEARILHFPKDSSLGMLKVRDIGMPDVEPQWWWGQFIDWEYIGEAVGDVAVPAGKDVALIVSKEAWRDLSPLAKLDPNALHTLAVDCERHDTDKPGDKCMPHITTLSGLQTLVLYNAGITNEALTLLMNLESLEKLMIISEQLDDGGVEHIGKLRWLKGLRYYSPHVTNESYSHVAKLTSLEEFFPGGKLTDQGLVYLVKLPKLRHLMLSGKRAGAQGLAHLAGCPSLNKIEFLEPPLSDEWFDSLSTIKTLKELRISNTNLDDEQLGRLKSLSSLKELELQGGFGAIGASVGDSGLTHLAQIKSLESLDLRYGRFTDEGLRHLCSLPGLRRLFIPNNHSFTADGLRHLTQMQSLEELGIGSRNLTDAGLSYITEMTALKNLRLFDARLITNDGVARLAALKALQKLNIFYAPKVTIAGVNCLNTLTNLEELEAYTGRKADDTESDKAKLNIGQLTKLRKLRISICQDEDLACLAHLKHLKTLELTGRGPLTDKGLVYLRGLTCLTQLRIDNACLTDEGLENLADMKKLSTLTISGDFTGDGLRNLERLKGLTYLRIISVGSLDSNAVGRLRQKLPNLLQIQRETRELPTFVTRLVRTGRVLPLFEHIEIDFSIEDNTGKRILLCFFDMQQRPSRNCITQIAIRLDELKQKGVMVVAVQASNIGKSTIDDWVEKNGISFPVGMIQDDKEKTRFSWGVKSLPWLILTDREHVVIAEGFGLDEMDNMIEEMKNVVQ